MRRRGAAAAIGGELRERRGTTRIRKDGGRALTSNLRSCLRVRSDGCGGVCRRQRCTAIRLAVRREPPPTAAYLLPLPLLLLLLLPSPPFFDALRGRRWQQRLEHSSPAVSWHRRLRAAAASRPPLAASAPRHGGGCLAAKLAEAARIDALKGCEPIVHCAQAARSLREIRRIAEERGEVNDLRRDV